MVGSAIKNWVSNFWGETSGTDDPYDDPEDNVEVEGEDYGEEGEETGNFIDKITNRRPKVVPMPQPQQIEMKIYKPTNYDQVYDIIAQLKSKNAIVFNLEYVSKDVARRIVDTACGAVSALDGHMEKVSNSIFVVAPYNYNITFELTKDKIENKLASSFFTKSN